MAETAMDHQNVPDADTLLNEAAWLRRLAQELVGSRGPDAVDDLVQDTMLIRMVFCRGPCFSVMPPASAASCRSVMTGRSRLD